MCILLVWLVPSGALGLVQVGWWWYFLLVCWLLGFGWWFGGGGFWVLVGSVSGVF